jgi:hypothetical protein
MTNFTSGQVGDAAGQVHRSTVLEIGMRAGIVAFGVVHLLIAWIALQLAWTTENRTANTRGALHSLAAQPFGGVLLWVTAIGLVGLAIWQALEAVIGRSQRRGFARIRRRLTCAGRAVACTFLAVLAFGMASGSGGGSGGSGAKGGSGGGGGGSSKDTMTAHVLNMTGGQLLVTLLGLAIVGIAIFEIAYGVRKSFKDDLDHRALTGPHGQAVVRLAQAGYIAKGVAIGIVGILFAWAAITYEPKKAGGLDSALNTLLDQPYGAWLLSAVALGIAAFGVYCFAWARWPKTA